VLLIRLDVSAQANLREISRAIATSSPVTILISMPCCLALVIVRAESFPRWVKERQDAEAERFRNEAGFAKLAADWPTTRLVEIWNSLPGVNPVAKFKDRATAVSRIWKVIQTLG
jgi:hypothetical protein